MTARVIIDMRPNIHVVNLKTVMNGCVRPRGAIGDAGDALAT